MLKKAFFTVILIVFLALVYSNGNARDVSLKSIEKQLQSNTNIEEMKKCSNRDLMQFIGLDYELFDSHLYYKSKEALGVEEVLIIKVDNKESLNSLKDAVYTRIEDQTKTFDGYGPTQVSLLKNAIVTTKGNYLFYCVSKTPEKYEEVFLNAI